MLVDSEEGLKALIHDCRPQEQCLVMRMSCVCPVPSGNLT